MTSILLIIGGGLFAAGWTLLVIRWSQPGMPQETYALWALGSAAFFLYDVLAGNPGWAAFQGCIAAYWAWMWWRGRRNGRMKKAVKELGAKSKARIDALVEQLTPSPIPVPGGAR